MVVTSKTGLTPSPLKKIWRSPRSVTIQLCAIAYPAPFVLKPFAGLYNPYPYGCSLLCNHPTDSEAKDLVKKAIADGKNVLLKEEVDAIRAGMYEQTDNDFVLSPMNQVTSVPEELFRRYTETDSRPLTPAPTLASGATRASGSTRRCVTPDPLPPSKVRERTLLILDLRRSHSQETLSFYGSSLPPSEPPTIHIQQPESLENEITPNNNKKKSITKNCQTKQSTSVSETKKLSEDDDVDDEYMKRRGKRRKKKGRDSGIPAFQASLDPETQVSAIGNDSHNPSARHSLVPGNNTDDIEKLADRIRKKESVLDNSLDIDSYLDTEILKYLRRQLNEEIVDSELDNKRKMALEEALRTITTNTKPSSELVEFKKNFKTPSVNVSEYLTLPRSFTRSSARFELPMDSRSFNTMTPIEYAREHVSVSNGRKLLYNCIFSKYQVEHEIEVSSEYCARKILAKNMKEALNLMMGTPMKQDQFLNFQKLMEWNNNDEFDFKTFCGICALCERLLAPEYFPQLPDRKKDPCHEIETADFEILSRKLYGRNVNVNLEKILRLIKTL